MVFTNAPTYYDSFTSLCKTILPFKQRRRLPAIAAAERRQSKQQSDNLKWQQDSFHQILNLMGLCKEGILPVNELSAFRSHLLDTLIASPVDHEHPAILRDKLIFLQELLYAKCISEDEYHSSKRPLLQRLALQGGEIEARNVIIGGQNSNSNSNEGWSVIDLKDEQCLGNKESSNSKMKQTKGAASVFSFISSNHKSGKAKELDKGTSCKNELGVSRENPFWDSNMRDKDKDKDKESQSILMADSLPLEENVKVVVEKGKKKAFRSHWGFEGLKRWKKGDLEDETAPLSLSESSPAGEGPDSKKIKRKLHADGSPSDFFIDKVLLGDKIKKELSQIQTELNSKNPNAQFTNDQIDAISTRLPVDRADLKKFFPKSWCDRYGDVVLDVVRKEFKDHVGEMKNLQSAAIEKKKNDNSKRWATFDEDDDDENCHPNLFHPQGSHSFPTKQANPNSFNNTDQFYVRKTDKCYKNNPFFDD